MSTLEITDIGAIEHLSLPIPAEGGVVVIRGANGSGKSTAIEAVQSAASGKGKLQKRDKTVGGSLEGLGVKLTVKQSTTRRGELECASLEGRLSVADLVDPGLIDPAAADNRRIKALVALAGVRPDPALFHSLAGGKEAFEKLCRADVGDDMVALAGRIKADLEKAARAAEQQAEHADAHAKAAKEATDGIDLDVEADADALRERLEAAVIADRVLTDKAEEVAANRQRAATARLEIAKAEDSWTGATVAEAHASLANAIKDRGAAHNAATKLREQLRVAEALAKRADEIAEGAEKEAKAADEHEAAMGSWREQVAAGDTEQAPSEAAIFQARETLEKARAADHAGVKIREARKKAQEHEKHREEAKRLTKEADALRTAAKGTDDVLSEIVSKLGTPIVVRDGRLVTRTDRGDTYFAELSDGERWRAALDIAIEQVGMGGVLAIPQAAWQDLDPDNRRAIAEHVKGRGVVVITAEATNGQIRAECFE